MGTTYSLVTKWCLSWMRFCNLFGSSQCYWNDLLLFFKRTTDPILHQHYPYLTILLSYFPLSFSHSLTHSLTHSFPPNPTHPGHSNPYWRTHQKEYHHICRSLRNRKHHRLVCHRLPLRSVRMHCFPIFFTVLNMWTNAISLPTFILIKS